MKLHQRFIVKHGCKSLPVRGAWVEIAVKPAFARVKISSLPVRGAWVEMRREHPCKPILCSRSPCGERGLK